MSTPKLTHTFSARIFIYPGDSAQWHFIGIPKQVGQHIRATSGARTRGFGSIPVTVIIGETTWQTSIFRDKASESYLLPIKAMVRKKEDLQAGDKVLIQLVINKI